jgi:arabinan endo-1,5-alpha-L-arabinosidase
MVPVRIAPLLTVVISMLVGASAIAGPPTAAAAPAADQAAPPWKLRGDLAAHDPALIAGEGGKNWYVFSTGEPEKGGGTIQIRSSPDGRNWTYVGTMWDAIPAWVSKAVPGVNNLWAPEIRRHGGTYYLYYAASTWGKNRSVIALATNTTLDPKDPNYKWVDKGEVLRSMPDDDFNAIDAGVIEDAEGTPWMAFGSYWSGIRMVQLKWPSGKVESPDEEPLHIADRKASPNAIEAPYIVPHGGYYYLFTSWGQCCQGVNSDYKIVVGRSTDVTGPYVDREGRKLLEGGGTTLRATQGSSVGPGGQSVSRDIIAFHHYDATAGGAPRLVLQPLTWAADGWPELTSPQ